MSVTMDDLAYYMRRCKELENQVEELTKKVALLEKENDRPRGCGHTCHQCDMEDYRWI